MQPTREKCGLVDEFQDTDPLQTEIFWRLCGEPPTDGDDDDWTAFVLRSGALFLVGDPKQAIMAELEFSGLVIEGQPQPVKGSVGIRASQGSLVSPRRTAQLTTAMAPVISNLLKSR